MSNPGNVNTHLELSPVGMGIRKISQNVAYGDLTDNGDATASLTMQGTIPVGAFVLGTKVYVKEGFSGDTTAVMTVGKSDGADEFTDGTSVNILAAGTVGESPEDPLEFIAAATSVYLKITGTADWGNVSAGKMLVEVFYLSSAEELSAGYARKADL